MDYNGYTTTVLNTSDSNTNDSMYYYDYDVETFTLPLNEIIPVAFVYGITLLLGIIGNILVIYTVATYQRMKTITNTFLVSLASADLLVILVCVPTKVSILLYFVFVLFVMSLGLM
jgi:hypothetical protein